MRNVSMIPLFLYTMCPDHGSWLSEPPPPYIFFSSDYTPGILLCGVENGLYVTTNAAASILVQGDPLGATVFRTEENGENAVGKCIA